MKTDSAAHHDLSPRAQEIGEAKSQPTSHDTQIWLTAEQPLAPNAATAATAATAAALLKSETAAESVVEFHLPSSTPEDDAVRAALQTPESRGTKPPGKTTAQLAGAAQVRGAGTSQSTTSPATDPAAAQPAAPTAAAPSR